MACTPGNKKWFTAASQKEAIANRKAWMDANPGAAAVITKGSLAEFVTTLWLPELLRRVASGTLRMKSYASYESTMRTHILPTIGGVSLARMEDSHVEQAMRAAAAKKRSARTIGGVRMTLYVALEFAKKRRRVIRNVATEVSSPALVKKQFDMPTTEEWERFLAACSTHRYEAVFLVLGIAGLRVGEALGLAESDVRYFDVDGEEWAELRVRRALQRWPKAVSDGGLHLVPPKTSAGVRSLVVPPYVAAALRAFRRRKLEWRLRAGAEWCNERQFADMLFVSYDGSPIDPSNLTRMYGYILRDAGWPHRPVHDLRHIAISNMIANGADLSTVKDVAGHSSVTVTQGIYGHVTRRQLDRAGEAMRLSTVRTEKKG